MPRGTRVLPNMRALDAVSVGLLEPRSAKPRHRLPDSSQQGTHKFCSPFPAGSKSFCYTVPVANTCEFRALTYGHGREMVSIHTEIAFANFFQFFAELDKNHTRWALNFGP